MVDVDADSGRGVWLAGLVVSNVDVGLYGVIWVSALVVFSGGI